MRSDQTALPSLTCGSVAFYLLRIANLEVAVVTAILFFFSRTIVSQLNSMAFDVINGSLISYSYSAQYVRPGLRQGMLVADVYYSSCLACLCLPLR